jgi:hypothetical protein
MEVENKKKRYNEMENKTSLYNLTTEYTDLYNKLLDSVDEETGELDMTISQALEAKGKEFTEKAVAVATVYRKFDNEITLYDNEIKRLKAIKERLERCRDRVKENLSTACERTGTTEIKGLYANVSFRASETVEIDNLESIPKQYLNEKVTVTADKTAIKQALKRGETIDGVHLEKHNNIQIK